MAAFPNDRPCVLYIDDEQANRRTFLAAFRQEFNVLVAADLAEAWPLLEQHDVHVVISDHRLSGIAGCATLRAIRERYPAVRRMLVTAHCDLQAVVDALNQAGVCYYIQKPWEAGEVRQAVQQAFAEQQAEAERAQLTDRLLAANRQLEFALRQQLLS